MAIGTETKAERQELSGAYLLDLAINRCRREFLPVAGRLEKPMSGAQLHRRVRSVLRGNKYELIMSWVLQLESQSKMLFKNFMNLSRKDYQFFCREI